MKRMLSRALIGFAGLVCLAAAALAGFLFYVFYEMKPPFNRANEELPTVAVENGNTVYCRMRYCDFRFPLPSNVRIVRTNFDGGGFDTINGAIYVVGLDGGPVNVRAYAEFLQKKHWKVTVGTAAGYAPVTNSRPDVPFVSSSGVVHYPLFNQMFAGSAEQVGGGIIVETEDHMTKIRFSYFGDY